MRHGCDAVNSEETRPEIVQLFLMRLFEFVPSEHYMVLTFADVGWKQVRHVAFPVRDHAKAAEAVVSTGVSRNVYVSACTVLEPPPPGRRVTTKTAAALVGLWADIDVEGPGHRPAEGKALPNDLEGALEIVEDPALPPSLVIETGGGLHAWWLLDRPVLIDDLNRSEMAKVSRRWGEGLVLAGSWRGVHVDLVADLARVMRVPGTFRTKPGAGPPHLVRFNDATTMNRYPNEWLMAAIIEPDPGDRVVGSTSRRQPVEVSRDRGGQNRQRSGRYGPADALAEVPWSEILWPWGFIYVGDSAIGREEIELWRRPHASSPYTLKVSKHGGWAVNWSSNVPLPSGGGTRLSKWRVYCGLYFAGDESIAARTMRSAQSERRALASR